MNDYQRVAQVIEYVAMHMQEQPDLDTLAQVAGLSPFHFHRLFSRWAGTTPKAFLQHLTVGEARRRLQDGCSVLDTSLDVGLSGPGRLHDLCVNLEAASPGEIKSGGAGWEIAGGFCETPFGDALLAQGPRGLCKLAFVADPDKEWDALRAMWPSAKIVRDDAAIKALAFTIFSTEAGGALPRSPIKLLVRGSEFQQKVWRALIQIPQGEVRSYGKVGEAMGNSGAARAVGTAAGQNPVAFLIPCHRVIQASGGIGQYHWGQRRKQMLLAWESAQVR
jgi:AraC family transcriptional regulator of adaptative response/methylated-DNA-[protein]-cysteine methyltransferase